MGERAHKLLARARDEIKKQQGEEKKESTLPPPLSHQKREEMAIHFSISDVVQAAFALLAIVLGSWLIIQLKDTIILFLLALFIAVTIDPGVQRLEHLGLPRGLAILLHYFAAIFLLFFLLISLIPIIASQLQQIAIFITLQVDAFLSDPEVSLPLLSDTLNRRLTDLLQATLQDISIVQFVDTLQQLGQNLSAIAQGSLRFATRLAGSIVSFVVNLIVVLVIAFFIQVEKEDIARWLRDFLPRHLRPYFELKSEAIHSKIGQWVRGQLLLALSIGTLVFIALSILRIPYALTLAALAAFTEFIPYIGPLLAAIPAILIALTQGGLLWAAIIIAVYYIIQWCENNLLVPLIMKRAVGLSPIAIIFAMFFGISFPAVIHPILGILLAVPLTTVLALFLEDWRELRSRK